jgi:Tol biopolymer transport system component
VFLLSGERKASPILDSPFVKTHFQFSPDSRWIAYSSNESGRFEVYVASVPSFAERRPVSTAGGFQPRWRNDGKELFYVAADDTLMAVEVQPGPTLETGGPKPLFRIAREPGLVSHQYTTGDGKKFLLIEPAAENAVEQLNVVLNWPAELGP